MQESDNLGENLIFIISQPRAGSTLLQRILGSHPDIHTVSEPWLLLPFVYTFFRERSGWANYDVSIGRKALREFSSFLPQGFGDYEEGIRRVCGYLYTQALSSSGKRYFLDKTPRYYLIIPELHRIFPEARFIVLLRNPLSVLNSILETWIKGSWFVLHRYKHDLLRAPRCLLEGVASLGDSGIVVRYEYLVDKPREEVGKICAALNVDFVPGMVEYSRLSTPTWELGDQFGVYNRTRPDALSIDKWMEALQIPQVWRLMHDYLYYLGEEVITQMGYSYKELFRILESHKPSFVKRWCTYPLSLLVNGLNWTEHCYVWERRVSYIAELLGQQGIRAAVNAINQKRAEIFNERK